MCNCIFYVHRIVQYRYESTYLILDNRKQTCRKKKGQTKEVASWIVEDKRHPCEMYRTSTGTSSTPTGVPVPGTGIL